MKKKVFIFQPYKPTWGLLFNELSMYSDFDVYVIYYSKRELRRKGRKDYYYDVLFKEIQLKTKIIKQGFERNVEKYNYLEIFKLLMKHKPDIVISGSNRIGKFVGSLKLFLGFKLIYWTEVNEVSASGNVPSFFSRLLYYNKIDAIATTSILSREHLKKQSYISATVKYFLVPYTVDETLFRVSEDEIKRKFLKTDAITITFSGSFIYRKGFDLLKQAVKKLNTKRYNYAYHLNCLGHDELGEEIANIKAHGFLQGDEYAGFFKKSHIFILPSRSEGYGVVVLQAAKTGNVILVSDGVGSRKDLCQDNGISFNRDSADAVFEALDKVLHLSRNDMLKMAVRSLEVSRKITNKNSAKGFKEAIDYILSH